MIKLLTFIIVTAAVFRGVLVPQRPRLSTLHNTHVSVGGRCRQEERQLDRKEKKETWTKIRSGWVWGVGGELVKLESAPINLLAMTREGRGRSGWGGGGVSG